MKHTEIERVAVVASTEELFATSLAAKSKELLGYDPTHIPVFDRLASGLAQLGIQPLDRRQVEQYKRSKEYRGITRVAKHVIIMFSAALVYVCGWMRFVPTATSAGQQALHVLAYLLVPLGLHFIIYGNVISSLRNWRPVREWSSVNIKQYRGYIPIHVISRACEIKALVPEVSISVDALQFERQQIENQWEAFFRRPQPDPFLVATLGKEEYYIDVWDETEFEQRTKVS